MKSCVSSVPNVLCSISKSTSSGRERVAIVSVLVNVNTIMSMHQRLKAMMSFDDVRLGLCRIVHEWPPGCE